MVILFANVIAFGFHAARG